MSWPNPTRRAALLGLLAASGCGFAPLYGEGSIASSLSGRITYQTPSTVAGFLLRSRLEERLGRPQATQYTLAITLTIERDNVAISEEGDITRFTLPGTANYALRDSNGNSVAQGRVNSFTSYSATGTTVATRAAEEDAEARLATILADQIVTRIVAVAP